MTDYDRILKWDFEVNNCSTCQGKDNCNAHHESLGVCQKWDYKYYANAEQLEALIAEAESGGHEWVRENTKFICDSDKCMAIQCDRSHPFRFVIGEPPLCRVFNIIPYRGNGSHRVTWPGKTGATHLEALRALRERGVIEATDEDCSVVEKKHPEKGCNFDEWPGDRSDKKYNSNKQAVEDMAREIKQDVLTDEVAYVAIKDITKNALAEDNKIENSVFRAIFLKGGPAVYQDDIIKPGDGLSPWFDYLKNAGYIQEVVCDPVVQMGDCFKIGDAIVQATFAGPWQMTLTTLIGGTPGAGFNGKISSVSEIKTYDCKLSDLVDKTRLKEFTPCKVKAIEV